MSVGVGGLPVTVDQRVEERAGGLPHRYHFRAGQFDYLVRRERLRPVSILPRSGLDKKSPQRPRSGRRRERQPQGQILIDAGRPRAGQVFL
jgi:hypothetical protein